MNCVFLMKIVEKQYINDFMKSQIHFSNCNIFIQNGKANGNMGRGDTLEGIFARININNIKLNSYIQHYKSIFGNDLDIEKDEQYINFFRKSTREMSISCFYSIDNKMLQDNFNRQYPDGNYSNKKFPMKIDEKNNKIYNFPVIIDDQYLKNYSAYKQDREVILIKAYDIITELKKLGFLGNKIEYIDKSQEFDIFKYCFDKLNKSVYDSANERMDLLFKDSNYKHENEYRFICPNKSLLDSNNNIVLGNLRPLDIKNKLNNINYNDYHIFINTKDLEFYSTVNYEVKKCDYPTDTEV